MPVPGTPYNGANQNGSLLTLFLLMLALLTIKIAVVKTFDKWARENDKKKKPLMRLFLLAEKKGFEPLLGKNPY